MSSTRLALQASFAPVVLLSSLGRAIADDATAPADTATPAVRGSTEKTARVAIGVNPPFRWWDGNAIAVSAYVGVTKHFAIRGNYASYEYDHNLVAVLAGASEELLKGRITDLGVSWMFFSRGLCDGLSLEVGLLHRGRDTTSRMEFETTAARTAAYSARAMIGWSWLFAEHAFISVAAGVSAGHETGTETTTVDPFFDPTAMPMTSDVDRQRISGEWFIRIGAAL